MLTWDEIKKAIDSGERVSGEVEIQLSEAVEEDGYGFDSLLAERLVGKNNRDKLLDIKYEVRGADGNTIKLHVSGEPRLLKEPE